MFRSSSSSAGSAGSWARGSAPWIALAGALVLAGAAAFVACSPVEENVPRLGGFKGERPNAGNDNGNTADGGAIVLDTACSGGPAASIAHGDCDVSFKSQIYPLVTTATNGCGSGTSCHGGEDSRLRQPLVGNEATVWQILVDFPFRDRNNAPLPYVNICSTDPAQSAISCNLDFDSPCGVPMPDQAEMSAGNKDLIKSWLECGAPLN